MIDYQQDVLNDGHICRNCFGLLRRERTENRKWAGEQSYHERLTWRTTIESVPDEPVSECTTLFCECGASGAYTRIWRDDEIDAARLRELVKNLYDSLVMKGFDVDVRQLARGADEAYHQLPPTASQGRGIGPEKDGQITTIDAVLEHAASEGVVSTAQVAKP